MHPQVSVVVPMRNEAAGIDELYGALTAALEGFGRPYEILAIDDGSTDATYERLAAIQQRDARWRIIRFRRNFGQTAAFAAGFAHARGHYIVTTDGDLQNDPSDIPPMIERAERHQADIVAGWRKDRKDPFISRRLPSMIANWIISHATGVQAARLRLLAEGVPRRSGQADEAVRRDAPLPAGHRQRVRRAHRRAGRDAPRAPLRQVQLRHLQDHPGDPGPDDRQVPDQLLDPSAPDLRRARARDGLSRRRW